MRIGISILMFGIVLIGCSEDRGAGTSTGNPITRVDGLWSDEVEKRSIPIQVLGSSGSTDIEEIGSHCQPEGVHLVGVKNGEATSVRCNPFEDFYFRSGDLKDLNCETTRDVSEVTFQKISIRIPRTCESSLFEIRRSDENCDVTVDESHLQEEGRYTLEIDLSRASKEDTLVGNLTSVFQTYSQAYKPRDVVRILGGHDVEVEEEYRIGSGRSSSNNGCGSSNSSSSGGSSGSSSGNNSGSFGFGF